MWASGDYPSMVETFLLPLGRRLVDASDIRSGQRVLDIAAGTGNASIPAARRGADVVASDLTPELFDAGRARAEAAGVDLEWVAADAEDLPFEDASFDVVMSAIGAMFAPRHEAVADELVRVCKPGGTIGLLSWTPEGQIGALFRAMGPYAPPPPPGARPPPLWGSEQHLAELFGDRVAFGTLTREDLQGPVRTDDRRARQRRCRRPRRRVRRAAEQLQRGVEPRHARRRPLRDGVPDRGRHARLSGERACGRPPRGARTARSLSARAAPGSPGRRSSRRTRPAWSAPSA
jgi:SAM-dependent methyltransferase